MREVAESLRDIMRRATGVDAPVENLARLSGGANMESSAFDHAGHAYVLRRSPSAEMMAGRVYGHDVEAAIVCAAFAAGVKAPEVIAEIAAQDDIGTGYIMRRVVAEVNPAKMLANPPPSLLSDLARELARIHAIPLDALSPLPAPKPADLIADMKTRFVGYGGDRPVFALAFKWLEDNLPTAVEPVLLHGDFRMGNIMVDDQGLAAVLDWELAHLGDRHQDLAFGCINSWRFGHIYRPAFGCGQFADLWAAYESESGIAVEPARFRWWLVYSTLWWGNCCLQMAEIWRTGMDASLERAVIGRRASETEVDLLMLLEDDAPEVEKSRRPEPYPEGVEKGLSPHGDCTNSALPQLPDTQSLHAANRDSPDAGTVPWIEVKQVQHDENKGNRRQGEPSTLEMLEALSAWIDTDIKPNATGRDKFMAAVALNAIGMLKREAENPVSVHEKALSDDLLAGRQSLATPGLLARLKAQCLRKLATDQPKYSALAVATQKWSGN